MLNFAVWRLGNEIYHCVHRFQNNSIRLWSQQHLQQNSTKQYNQSRYTRLQGPKNDQTSKMSPHVYLRWATCLWVPDWTYPIHKQKCLLEFQQPMRLPETIGWVRTANWIEQPKIDTLWQYAPRLYTLASGTNKFLQGGTFYKILSMKFRNLPHSMKWGTKKLVLLLLSRKTSRTGDRKNINQFDE